MSNELTDPEHTFIHDGSEQWKKMIDVSKNVGEEPNKVDRLLLNSMLVNFFPSGCRGERHWTDVAVGSENPFSFDKYFSQEGLNNLGRARATRSTFRTAKKNIVFLSHRRADHTLAVDLASAIQANSNFKVWLDIWDPKLSRISSLKNLTDRQKALLIAYTIEMGLLNSDGVIALITDNSKGSSWIPYEYGRIRKQSIYAKEAVVATQFKKRRPYPKLPEYMLLGGCHKFDPKHNGLQDIGGYKNLKKWLLKL